MAEHAIGYKWLDDAAVLRDELIDAAEHADHEPDPEARRRMLTVCVVGGGYTGVELIAELQDLFQSYIVPRYRGIDHGDYRLTSHSGNIEAIVPDSTSADVSARSVRGEVHDDIPLQPKQHTSFVLKQGSAFWGTMGRAAVSSTVVLRTFNGKIHLRKRSAK